MLRCEVHEYTYILFLRLINPLLEKKTCFSFSFWLEDAVHRELKSIMGHHSQPNHMYSIFLLYMAFWTLFLNFLAFSLFYQFSVFSIGKLWVAYAMKIL